MQEFSSLTSDWTHALGGRSTKSQPYRTARKVLHLAFQLHLKPHILYSRFPFLEPLTWSGSTLPASVCHSEPGSLNVPPLLSVNQALVSLFGNHMPQNYAMPSMNYLSWITRFEDNQFALQKCYLNLLAGHLWDADLHCFVATVLHLLLHTCEED